MRLELPSTIDLDKLKQLKLTLQAENEFPFELDVELRVVQNGSVQHQIEGVGSIASANVINEVAYASQSSLHFDLNAQETKNLFNADYVLLLLKINSQPANTPVQLYSNQRIQLSFITDLTYSQQL